MPAVKYLHLSLIRGVQVLDVRLQDFNFCRVRSLDLNVYIQGCEGSPVRCLVRCPVGCPGSGN